MIAIVIGTRPELIKIFPLVNYFKKNVKFKIIHTGQHYSKNLNDIFLSDFVNLVPDFNLKVVEATFRTNWIDDDWNRKIVKKHFFKSLIVYGDTNTALAGALVASKVKNLCLYI